MKSLARLRDDPQFKAQLEWDAYRAAGYTQDAKTGAWVGGDQALLDQFNRQVFSATHIPDGAQAMTGFGWASFALWAPVAPAPGRPRASSRATRRAARGSTRSRGPGNSAATSSSSSPADLAVRRS